MAIGRLTEGNYLSYATNVFEFDSKPMFVSSNSTLAQVLILFGLFDCLLEWKSTLGLKINERKMTGFFAIDM